jgi:hypothetical protein
MNTLNIQDLPVVKRFSVGGYVAFASGSTVKVGRVIPGSGAEYAAIELVDGTETEVTKAQCHKATPEIHAGKVTVIVQAIEEDGMYDEDEELMADDIDEVEGDEVESDDAEGEGDEGEGGNGSVVKRKYQDRYLERSGNRDNDDDLARKLRGADLEAVYKIAVEMSDWSMAELKAKYGHLNKGLQRMSLGNIVRSAAKNAA